MNYLNPVVLNFDTLLRKTWAKGAIGFYSQCGFLSFLSEVVQEKNITYSMEH